MGRRARTSNSESTQLLAGCLVSSMCCLLRLVCPTMSCTRWTRSTTTGTMLTCPWLSVPTTLSTPPPRMTPTPSSPACLSSGCGSLPSLSSLALNLLGLVLFKAQVSLSSRSLRRELEEEVKVNDAASCPSPAGPFLLTNLLPALPLLRQASLNFHPSLVGHPPC